MGTSYPLTWCRRRGLPDRHVACRRRVAADAPRQETAIALRSPRKFSTEAHRVEKHTTPPTPVIYETVRRNGEQEMSRPPSSLFCSGLAAGLSINFSLLAQALLRQHLPDAPWRELAAALGYPVGFLMVVLSRPDWAEASAGSRHEPVRREDGCTEQ